MGKAGTNFIFIVLLIFIAIASGCSRETQESETESASKEEFRIPDSLLSPIQGFKLTRDDYHPVKGGVMENVNISLHYPPSAVARFLAVTIFDYAKNGYEEIAGKIGRPADGRIVLIGAKDLDEYMLLSRREWWYYGDVRGDTIYFEPLDIMIKRGIAEIAVTQKMAQAALLRLSGGTVPVWLREAVASYIAGEREILEMQVEEFRAKHLNLDPSPGEVEEHLEHAYDRGDTRIAFFAAYRMLENLLGLFSIEEVMEFVGLLGTGSTRDEAATAVFGYDYGTLLDKVRVDVYEADPPGKTLEK